MNQMDLATMAAQHGYSHGQLEIGDAENESMRDLIAGLIMAVQYEIEQLTAYPDTLEIRNRLENAVKQARGRK